MSDDPVRLDLSEDVPPDALDALRLARADAPAAVRLAAIEAGVLSRLPPPAGGGGGGGGGAPMALKAGAAAVAAGAVVVAVVLASRSTPPPPLPPVIDAAPPVASVRPTVAVSSEPTTISVDDLPSASSPPAAPSAPPPEDPAEQERAEVALLDRAQASLSSSPSDTLARCDEHAKRFANGALVQEREVLAIDALIRLGRRSEAEARAERFKQAFPRSAQLRRIEALLVH